MQPLLQGGEAVEVVPLVGTLPSLGDILFFYDQQKNPLVHRLIWRRRQKSSLLLLTKGDACLSFDGFIPIENVLGRVQRILPANGKTINLQTLSRRFQAALIVSCTLINHALRKAVMT